MTKDGMNKEEKAILLGMGAILNNDLCQVFVCPEEGCDECPLRPVMDAQEQLIKAIAEVPEKLYGAEI